MEELNVWKAMMAPYPRYKEYFKTALYFMILAFSFLGVMVIISHFCHNIILLRSIDLGFHLCILKISNILAKF